MRIRLTIAALLALGTAETAAQLGGQPGAFSRMGFGARGMGMGNAMTAVWTGDLVGYYNPALLPWGQTRNASASFGLLSLDRSLNFLQYTQPVRPIAGVSAGLINAGLSDIDGRDSDGEPTGPLRTSENQIFLGFGARFQERFSVGLNFKLYYYQLYTDIRSTTVGLDIGAFFRVTDDVAVGFTARDVNSKYKWDTGPLYGTFGAVTVDYFPRLYTFGAAWLLPDSLGLISADVELSSAESVVLRAGAEIPIVPDLILRIGVDRIDVKKKGMGVRPAAGFTFRHELEGWTPAVNYAFVLEPFAPGGIHMISLSAWF